MKYKPEMYARAFAELLVQIPQDRHERLADRLLALLKQNGDEKLLPKVVALVTKRIAKEEKIKTVRVEVARATAVQSLHALQKTFSQKDHVTVEVNPDLIAGTRVTINDELQLDYSLARKLQKMFA